MKKNYERYADNLKKTGNRYGVVQNTTPQTVVVSHISNGLKCPVCGSMDVKRISNTSRAISVELMVLASSKIGKQYECRKCKHKW